MYRDNLLQQFENEKRWDVVVIGGGATGVGTALDATLRGFKTLLLEQKDFAAATSSRSTKLIHGGVRYLRQANFKLVRESLLERERLLRNAPGIVKAVRFVLPCYTRFELPFYGLGLKLYDLFAGKSALAATSLENPSRVESLVPGLRSVHLKGPVVYSDAQFDDARLALAIVKNIVKNGGCALNYMRVIPPVRKSPAGNTVLVHDLLSPKEYEITARCVINATGIFSSDFQPAGKRTPVKLTLSRGSHIVLDKKFLPGEHAVIIPKTKDGRVIFAIPWQNIVLIGTTDVAQDKPQMEPMPLAEEIDYLLEYAGQYLKNAPERSDIKSVFAGIRPLVKAGIKQKISGTRYSLSGTASISRDHFIWTSNDGVVHIAGGKWTTYRKMAEDVVNKAIKVSGLEKRPCRTYDYKIEGMLPMEQDAASTTVLSEGVVRRAVMEEMAVNLDDVIARRTRLLFTDARAAADAAESAAETMAEILSKNQEWVSRQVRDFLKLQANYLPDFLKRRDFAGPNPKWK